MDSLKLFAILTTYLGLAYQSHGNPLLFENVADAVNNAIKPLQGNSLNGLDNIVKSVMNGIVPGNDNKATSTGNLIPNQNIVDQAVTGALDGVLGGAASIAGIATDSINSTAHSIASIFNSSNGQNISDFGINQNMLDSVLGGSNLSPFLPTEPPIFGDIFKLFNNSVNTIMARSKSYVDNFATEMAKLSANIKAFLDVFKNFG